MRFSYWTHFLKRRGPSKMAVKILHLPLQEISAYVCIVSLLLQNSLALVNASIRCTVDSQNNYMVSGQPVISIGGISGTFVGFWKTSHNEALIAFYSDNILSCQIKEILTVYCLIFALFWMLNLVSLTFCGIIQVTRDSAFQDIVHLHSRITKLIKHLK